MDQTPHPRRLAFHSYIVSVVYNDIHCTVAGVVGVVGVAGVAGVVGGMWLLQLSHNRRYICIRYTYYIFYKNILPEYAPGCEYPSCWCFAGGCWHCLQGLLEPSNIYSLQLQETSIHLPRKIPLLSLPITSPSI